MRLQEHCEAISQEKIDRRCKVVPSICASRSSAFTRPVDISIYENSLQRSQFAIIPSKYTFSQASRTDRVNAVRNIEVKKQGKNEMNTGQPVSYYLITRTVVLLQKGRIYIGFGFTSQNSLKIFRL